MIIWKNFPVPPSHNHVWEPVATKCPDGKWRGRIILSKEARDYAEHEVYKWRVTNLMLVGNTIKTLRDWAQKDLMIRLDAYYVFPSTSIWTLKDTPKRLDVRNRLKLLDDCVAEMIGRDDCEFFSGYQEKLEDPKAQEPYAHLVFSPFAPRSISQLDLSVSTLPLN